MNTDQLIDLQDEDFFMLASSIDIDVIMEERDLF